MGQEGPLGDAGPAYEFRVAVSNGIEIVFAFASASEVSDTVRSTFVDLSEVPGTTISAAIAILDVKDLEGRYRKLLLGEAGKSTDVKFKVQENQMHRPQSVEPVIYLTVSASEYVSACGSFGMELFRYNPRLYLGKNKVNASIAETLKNDASKKWFHLMNNGVTAVCKHFEVEEKGGGARLVTVEDFQVVNGCQTTMTLFTNSASFKDVDDCLVDIKIIQSPGLRDLISRATNTQTAILAEDSFANEVEQKKIADLLKRHGPPWFYAPKRGSWERLSTYEKTQYLDDQQVYGRHRRLTSKELASVCLAIFGNPESAKDKPRIAFEKVDGKNSPLYERIFRANNTAAQWLLPFQLFRYANALVKKEAEKDPDSDRARIGSYGRYRMVYLAYEYLRGFSGEVGKKASDFLSGPTTDELLAKIESWGSPLLEVALDALVDGFSDAQARGESSGLREFFREAKHRSLVLERFDKALIQTDRLAKRGKQTLLEYLGLK